MTVGRKDEKERKDKKEWRIFVSDFGNSYFCRFSMLFLVVLRQKEMKSSANFRFSFGM